MDGIELSPRAAKRARFEEPTDLPGGLPVEDEMDDIYGPSTTNEAASGISSVMSDHVKPPKTDREASKMSSLAAGIPGLGMLAASISPPVEKPSTSSEPVAEMAQLPKPMESIGDEQGELDGFEREVSHPPILDEDKDTQVNDIITIAANEPADAQVSSSRVTEGQHDATAALLSALGPVQIDAVANEESNSKGMQDAVPTTLSAGVPKASLDGEFMEAAQANKDNPEAEWQFNSSDDESSSSDSSSDDSSDDDSDEGYELLDAETTAKMLLAEVGDDEDNAGSKATTVQLRTKNEKPEEIVPKPDVVVTEEMKVTKLGAVEHVVDNFILIKAYTSGEYQVLEQGSVLCLESRQVIGAVAETIGRVQEPMYSVAFTKAADISDLGIAEGGVIFYVDAHSTFVFTQPLRSLKGTDASNIHDEEIGEEEIEFSDDEAEAAYKRAKKEAKRGGKAGNNAYSRADTTSYPGAQPYTGGAINYDDEEAAEDTYTPLARPDNLQALMVNGRTSPEARQRRPFPDRGRGRGAGRGRGDRGRGDRGRGDRGRGGRGGRDNGDRQRQGVSHSFPDNHNSQTPVRVPQALPPKPAVPQAWSPAQAQQNFPQPPPLTYPQVGQQQHYQQPQSAAAQSFAWPPPPNPQHLNQLYPSYNGQQPAPYQQMPPTPGGSIPPGAFVNPAFFPNQQYQQPPAPPPPPQYQQYAQQYSQQNTPVTNQAAITPEQYQAAQDLYRRLYGQQ